MIRVDTPQCAIQQAAINLSYHDCKSKMKKNYSIEVSRNSPCWSGADNKPSKQVNIGTLKVDIYIGVHIDIRLGHMSTISHLYQVVCVNTSDYDVSRRAARNCELR